MLLREGSQQFFLGAAVEVQSENKLGLGTLKILAGAGENETVGFQQLAERLVFMGHIGVDFDDIALNLLGQSLRPLHELIQGGFILQIAHRTTAGIQHSGAYQGGFPDQKGAGTLDFAILPTDGDGPPGPGGFDLAPHGALREMSLGMGRDKGLIFGQGFIGNKLVHGDLLLL